MREELIGSVACYGNEIDDLFVVGAYRHKGYGKQLLIWAMDHIASSGSQAKDIGNKHE